MNKPKLYLFNYTHCNGVEIIESIKTYVSSRYPRFLDYAKYHSAMAGIPDEANDVLNEVMLSLFSKDFEYLVRLYSTKRNNYTDLDFFILNMVKINCHSMTSPYRHKNRPIGDSSVDYQKLKIIDEPDEEVDNAAITLKQFRLVRYIFERLELTDLERKVFEHGFILNNPVSEFKETHKRVFYSRFNLVKDSIHEILYYHKLTSKRPIPKNDYKLRRKQIVSSFLSSRKLIIKHSEN